MEMSKNNLKKGFYNHPQYDAALSLKHFLIIEKAGKQCLLLRYVNDSQHIVKSAEFILTQKNSSGRIIGKSRLKYRNMNLLPGDTYTPSKGTVISKDCADFTVKLVRFVSGEYKYTFKKAKEIANYDIMGYETDYFDDKIHTSAAVSYDNAFTKKLYRRIAWITVAAAAVAFGIVLMYSFGMFSSFGVFDTFMPPAEGFMPGRLT